MPPPRSLAATVRQPPIVVGRTHASTVMPVLRSSEAVSGTVTQSLVPSNESAPLFLPDVVQVAPETAPSLPLPDASATSDPDPASNEYAATSPSDEIDCLGCGRAAQCDCEPDEHRS